MDSTTEQSNVLIRAVNFCLGRSSELTKSSEIPETPKRKSTISRIMRFKEVTPVSKKKRIITVKYLYNRDTKTLTYGATIHSTIVNSKEKFDKLGHNLTAIARFDQSPIIIHNFTSDKDLSLFNLSLRKQIGNHGVKSKVIGTPDEYTLTKDPVPKQKKVVPSPQKKTLKSKVPRETKEMKPEITKLMNIKETTGDMKRIITIKYNYDRINNVLTYGATINRSKLGHPERYNKEGHKLTAEKRFNKHPVIIQNFTDDKGQRAFNEKLRKALYSHGVQDKK